MNYPVTGIRKFPIYVILPLVVAAASLLGILSGNRVLLIVFNFLPAWPLMMFYILKRRIHRAVGVMLLWALCLAVFMSVWCGLMPGKAAESVLMGEEYRDEMFHWIRTGEGAEGDPAQFIPLHILHLTVFAAAALISLGVLAILFGIVLMDYMSFYAGSLVARSSEPLTAVLMGWHVWSLFRVAAFVVLGIVCTEISAGFLRKKFRMSDYLKKLVLLSVGLLTIDIVLKWLLAPVWREILREITVL